jgi:hypothetical protein
MKCGTKEMCKKLAEQKEKERKKNNAILVSYMNLLDAGFTKEFTHIIMKELVDDISVKPISITDCVVFNKAFSKIKENII